MGLRSRAWTVTGMQYQRQPAVLAAGPPGKAVTKRSLQRAGHDVFCSQGVGRGGTC